MAQERGHHCVTVCRTQLPTRAGEKKGSVKPCYNLEHRSPSLPWKIKHNSNEIFFPRHRECLTLAATSIAWSPTALRGGRRSVSTERLATHLAQHLAPPLLWRAKSSWPGRRGRDSTILSRPAPPYRPEMLHWTPELRAPWTGRGSPPSQGTVSTPRGSELTDPPQKSSLGTYPAELTRVSPSWELVIQRVSSTVVRAWGRRPMSLTVMMR